VLLPWRTIHEPDCHVSKQGFTALAMAVMAFFDHRSDPASARLAFGPEVGPIKLAASLPRGCPLGHQGPVEIDRSDSQRPSP